MKILLDLNVLLDVIQKREPHYADSAAVLSLVAEGEVGGAVAGHAVTTVYYLVEKYADAPTADRAVDWILRQLSVVGEGRDLLLRARALGVDDFEDAVVVGAAEEAGCDWIVTRNVDDFGASPVPALTPREFVASLDAAGERE